MTNQEQATTICGNVEERDHAALRDKARLDKKARICYGLMRQEKQVLVTKQKRVMKLD